MDSQEISAVIVEIKKLLDEKEYDKVIKICSDEDYIQDKDIQHYMIIALLRAKRYEEGLEKVNEFLSQGYSARLEAKKIIFIQELYGLEEALKECKEVEHKKDASIYYREAAILFELGRFDEALELCEKNKEAEGKYKDMFLTLKSKIREEKKPYLPESLLLTKISICKIDIKEIQTANIEKWKKDLLLVAYYDKMFNQKQAFFWAKQLRRDVQDDLNNRRQSVTNENERKVIDAYEIDKMQMVHSVYDKFMETRYRPFGIKFFEDMLDCKVNPEYAEEIKNMKKEKKEKHKREEKKPEVKVEVKVEEPKEEKKEKTIISSLGIVVNNRYNNTNKVSDINIDNNKDKYENVLIKDYYREETVMLGKYLYACMYNSEIREKAIKAYDKLMTMVYKPVSDTKALTKFVDLLRRINHAIETDMIMLDTTVVELDISMGTVENKYEKVIK